MVLVAAASSNCTDADRRHPAQDLFAYEMVRHEDGHVLGRDQREMRDKFGNPGMQEHHRFDFDHYL